MKLEGSLNFQSERTALWTALRDANVWKETIAEAERFEQLNENEYEAAIHVDIGPIKGIQTLKLIFSNFEPPKTCDFRLENQFVKEATGHFDLKLPEEVPPPPEGEEATPIPEGTKTVLFYNMDIDAGNPFFNAALEGFKGKVKEGFEELMTNLETRARAKS